MHLTARPPHQGTRRQRMQRIRRRLANLRAVWTEDLRDLAWLHWYAHKEYGDTRCYWYMVPVNPSPAA